MQKQSKNWPGVQYPLKGSQLAKMKKSRFLTSPCHKIWSRSSLSKKFQLYFKNYDFNEYVKFGAISWKLDILSITASVKFDQKSSAHMWHLKCDYLPHNNISCLVDFQLKSDFPSQCGVGPHGEIRQRLDATHIYNSDFTSDWKDIWSSSFCEILALNYAPGAAAPRAWIIWSNIPSQVCSRSI